MADDEEMQAYFEKYFEEHGFDPVKYDYRIVNHKAWVQGQLHDHTHLVAIPKKEQK